MHPRRFKKELHRRVSRDLLVVRGPRAARKLGLPREAVMVFEKSRSGTLAFVHACLKRDGTPREPHQRDVETILRGHGHYTHRGSRSWIDDVTQQHAKHEERIMQQYLDEIALVHQEEVTPRVWFAAHQKRVFTTGKR